MTTTDTYTPAEMAALALWRAYFGREPQEPLRAKGGALDPNAWCMEAVEAVVQDRPIPRIVSDREPPPWTGLVVREALMAERQSPNTGEDR